MKLSSTLNEISAEQQKLRMLGLNSLKRKFQSWRVRPKESGNSAKKMNQIVETV